MRGAWIEICFFCAGKNRHESLPVRGAWIEISQGQRPFSTPSSLPVRGAWIEILMKISCNSENFVAPRAGSVD